MRLTDKVKYAPPPCSRHIQGMFSFATATGQSSVIPFALSELCSSPSHSPKGGKDGQREISEMLRLEQKHSVGFSGHMCIEGFLQASV